jgi:hypothetical protein
VDDTNILATGRSIEESCKVLEEAHEKCIEWARTHGATFAPAKYSLMHLTRRPKKFNLAAVVNIPRFHGAPSPVIRVLGVLIDPRLRWEPHMKYVQSEVEKRTAAMNRILAST